MLKRFIDQLVTSPLVGVDIGSSALKAVELSRSGEKIMLRRCVVAPLDGGDAVRQLKRAFTEAGITSTHAALGLAAPGVIVKPFGFPAMPRKELAGAVQLEAEQAILNGHSPNEMAIDWHTIPNGAGPLRGVLAVVPRAVVSTRVRVARAAGLRPVIVDVEGLALWNAYWALEGSAAPVSKTILLINVGARTTNVVIATSPDTLILVRDFPLGASALKAGQGDDWRAEVSDSLSYARSAGGLRALDAVYVTGGGSGPELMPLLKSAVTAPVTYWNPLGALVQDRHHPIEPSTGPLLAIAIGLALRQPS